jgi:AraC-like DNA-binding protein
VNRRIITIERSVLRIEQRIRISPVEIGTDVSGPVCIYAHVEVTKGSVLYLRGDTRIPAPRRFAVFLPPFAVVQARLDKCHVTTAGLAFRPSTAYVLPGHPVLLPATADRPPASVEEVVSRLHSLEGAIEVGRAPDPLPIVLKAKRILDTEYGTSLSIGHVAKRIRVSPALLSRAFKNAYGMPPVRYRHQLRIMDALMRFAEGEAPVDVFQDVGFDDLSRFYKVFRKVACAAPGSYRPVRSRNAKT